jgi:hypothetical protein
MLLQVCDQCGRPLSEGAIARGEAVTRDGETICTQCTQRMSVGKAAGLDNYQGAVWHCEGCGIPVSALDLIEGRASRAGGALHCSRCVTKPSRPTRAMPRATPLPAARSQPARTTRAAEEFVKHAGKDRRFPALPVVLFIIVLPMFAVSLWFAVTSQHRLNLLNAERTNGNGATPQTPAPRPAPANTTPSPVPAPMPELDPEPAPVPAPQSNSLAVDVAAELVSLERELAAPVIRKLESEELGDVWEGLIEAGSRRLIAARPHVRALLGESDDETRLLACRVAALLDDKDALPELARMLEHDPSEPVRMEARKARDRLTGRSTREIRDMAEHEIEELMRDLQRELQRRRASHD